MYTCLLYFVVFVCFIFSYFIYQGAGLGLGGGSGGWKNDLLRKLSHLGPIWLLNNVLGRVSAAGAFGSGGISICQAVFFCRRRSGHGGHGHTPGEVDNSDSDLK